MKRILAAVAAVLTLAAQALGQTVTVPEKVSVAVGRMASIPITSDGKDTRWYVTPGDRDVFREYDPNPAVLRLRLVAYKAGTYYLIAFTSKGDVTSSPAVCTITVGEQPEPGPGPGPTPTPTPTPSAGLKVLIVYESSERAKLTAQQETILSGKPMRDWLIANCSADQAYPKGYAIWDKDVDTTGMPAHWKNALASAKSVPWLVVMDGDGKVVHGEALPADTAATIAVLSKYVPKKAG